MHRFAFYLSLLLIFLVPWERLVYFESLGTISRLMGFVVAGIWGLSALANGVRKLSAFHFVVVVFALWNAISLFWSVAPDQTVAQMGTYLRLTALTVIVWDLYRTPDSVRLALQAFVLGGLVPAASTISNYLSGVQTSYGRYSTSADGMNATAFILALTVPLALYLAVGDSRDSGPRWLRWFNFVCRSFVALFAIALTATRFAIIMTFPAWLYLLTRVFRLSPVRAVAVVAVTIGGLLVVTQLIPEDASNRLATTHSEITTGDLTGRTMLWKLGLKSFVRHPLVGIGAGAEGEPCVFALGRPTVMHNSFLAVSVELGVVGLMLMLAILGIVFRYAWWMPRGASTFWLTVLAVWGLGNLAVSVLETKETWLLLGLLVADAFAWREDDSQAPQSVAASGSQPQDSVGRSERVQ